MGVLNRKRTPDTASQIEAAVAKAMGQQAKPAPAPSSKPARLSNVIAALNAVPAPPPPAPMPPVPTRQPPQLTSLAIQRDSNGKIAAVSVAGSNGSRHHLVAQRDQLGRMHSITVDDRTTFRILRGGYGEITGAVPVADAPD